MKKIMTIALAAVSLAACNNTETTTTTVDTNDTSHTMTNNTNDAAYAPSEGDVTYRDNTVKVWRSGEWKDADDEVRLDNGTVVYRSGKVKKDGKEVELEDGEIVNKEGRFFDKTGRAIEDAWGDVKQGAKEMAHDVGNAAEKVGKKTKDAVDKDDKKK